MTFQELFEMKIPAYCYPDDIYCVCGKGYSAPQLGIVIGGRVMIFGCPCDSTSHLKQWVLSNNRQITQYLSEVKGEVAP